MYYKKIIIVLLILITFNVGYGDFLKPKIIGDQILFKYENENANKVFLAGTFNNWSNSENEMKKNNDGIFTIKMLLKPREYEYKFVVDNQWVPDGDNLKIKIKFDKNGNIIFDKPVPTSNTPMSEKVFFSGFYYSVMDYSNTRADSTSFFKFIKPNDILKIKLRYKINTNVFAYTEFLYEGWDFNRNLDIYKALINANLDNINMALFLNEQIYYPYEPLGIFDNEIFNDETTEYFTFQPRKKTFLYGENKKGILARITTKIGNMDLIYDDNLITGLDKFFVRYMLNINNVYFGLNYVVKRDYNESIPEPQNDINKWAEYPEKSGKWYHFDTFPIIINSQSNKYNSYSCDIKTNIVNNLTVYGAFNYFEDKHPVFYSHADEDNQGPNGNRKVDITFSSSSKTGEKIKAGFIGTFKTKNKIELSFQYDNENIIEIDYDKLIYDKKITSRSINPYVYTFNLKTDLYINKYSFFIYADYKNCNPIDNYEYKMAFFHFHNDYTINRLFRVGTNSIITIRPLIKIPFGNNNNLRIENNFKLFSGIEINESKSSFYNEFIIANEYKYSESLIFIQNIRNMYYNFGKNYKISFLDFFLECKYRFKNGISISIGYGVDPEINPDIDTGRYYFLEENFNNDKTNYIDKLMESERLLNNYSNIYIKVKAKY